MASVADEPTDAATPPAANLPALPGDIGPDEPSVSFRMMSCRGCPQLAPWVRDDHAENSELYDWQHAHAQATGHRQYYVWTMSRNTAKTFML